ncbi:hypothetical protein C3469_04310 [Mycobacterium kansasii]|uniref:hypothetical protein n=1 Tax=Mycobacterium kansasii TaxID=1768 RepID=UPI000CDDF12B|nr:hypothetical protein [Mycobacterium kansasii]POY29126.1 hypothetical protein C3469_04310 [Mycobacterium kansasii]POY34232.1 hypothetical protein C3478_02230 [Mycobacterium kansasii]
MPTTTNDHPFPNVPVPPGVTADAGGWQHNLRDGGYCRALLWRSFGGAGGFSADIDGWQQDDGTYTRRISLWGDDGGNLTSAQARQVAAMLLDAADELDRWAAR